MLIISAFTLHTSLLSCICFIIICIILCWHLSRIMFRYCSKCEHSLTPNVLAKSLQLAIIRKMEWMILLDFQNGWNLNVTFLLTFFHGNMLQSNEIHSWFSLMNSTCLKCAYNFVHLLMRICDPHKPKYVQKCINYILFL